VVIGNKKDQSVPCTYTRLSDKSKVCACVFGYFDQGIKMRVWCGDEGWVGQSIMIVDMYESRRWRICGQVGEGDGVY